MNMLLSSAAIAYAARGFRVLPLHGVDPDGACSCRRASCRPGGKEEKSIGKHPRLPSWQRDATTDARKIASWWSRWPDANVGIATGAASGILVLDVDVHGGAPGFASLARLEAELGPLPRTLAAATGSGGQHRIFRHPGLSIRNSAGWRDHPGIDWRGEGGQIVAAPSVTPAGAYAWIDLSEIANLPPAWVEAHLRYEVDHAPSSPSTPSAPRPPPPPPTKDDLDADDAAIECCMGAANAEKFRTLWSGNWENTYDSQSEADLALCSIVAFFCDFDDEEPDPDRIDRIFQRSGLYRDKWDRADYRDRTIAIAVENERRRRADDAAFADLVGATAGFAPPAPPTPPPAPPPLSREALVAIERATLEAGAPPPPIPTVRSATATVTPAMIRKIVRRKRLAEGAQSKFDADLVENFMAGEHLVSPADAARLPQLARYSGEEGLLRVAWVLGCNLPEDVPWDAVVNARPQAARAPVDWDALGKAGAKYERAQAARATYAEKRRKITETRNLLIAARDRQGI